MEQLTTRLEAARKEQQGLVTTAREVCWCVLGARARVKQQTHNRVRNQEHNDGQTDTILRERWTLKVGGWPGQARALQQPKQQQKHG